MQKNNVYDIDEKLLRSEVEPHSNDFINNIIMASSRMEQKQKAGFSSGWIRNFINSVSENIVPNPALVMACALVIGLVSGFNNQSVSDYDETEFTSIFETSGSIL